MKLPASLLQTYRAVHSWIGIITSLLLFVAFFAGAISIFETPLRAFTTPSTHIPAPPSLDETPRLLERAFQQVPSIQNNYSIILHPNRTQPARLSWIDPTTVTHGHKAGRVILAALAADGHLIITPQSPAPTASFIEHLHETLGLPLPFAAGRLFTGIVSLLYSVALISGVIAFLPALARTLFSVRLTGRARQLWGDIHNLIGFISLPFHIVIAITATAFCFHATIFSFEKKLFTPPSSTLSHTIIPHHAAPPIPTHKPHHPTPSLLSPVALINSVHQRFPGFDPDVLVYQKDPHGRTTVRVAGSDARYGTRGPTGGFVLLDPYSGAVLSTQYLPGHQSRGFSVITLFFALHFGSFGGFLTRLGYLVMGFGGAFLFYTSPKLWLNSRRRREKARGLLHDSVATFIVERLTRGWISGCIIGIAGVIIVGSIAPSGLTNTALTRLYYGSLMLSLTMSFLGTHVLNRARRLMKKINGKVF